LINKYHYFCYKTVTKLKTNLAQASALLLFCGGSALAQDVAPPPWVPPAGLWNMAVSMSLMPTPAQMQLCSDGVTVPDALGMNAMRKQNANAMKCKYDPVAKAGTKATYRATCELDNAGSSTEVISTIEGDEKTSFKLDVKTTTSLSKQAPVSLDMTSKLTRIAKTCPAGMKAGDLKMPDGTVMRDGKPVKP
jgi:hypothetical protein